MMQTEAIPATQADEQAVAAVRRGDTERYRELVERHERKVYGVVWSRLGDPALAEEATQETFIRAYRRLSLLGEGAKFGAWLCSIARNVAINLGLRHRRELNKRERWALEEPDRTVDSAPADTADLCAPETLRQTLEELPSSARECLVLFYLEGNSCAEAAAMLDVTEATFRVRLSRARTALRERLEERLGESLTRLRPSKPLVAGIMAAILATNSAQAATVATGTAATSLSAKLLPAKWLTVGFTALTILPGMLFNWWLGTLERRNFREQDGFRTRLHRDAFRKMLWIFPLMCIAIGAVTQFSIRAWGYREMMLGLGVLSLFMLALSGRSLAINRSRYNLGMLGYIAVLTAGELLIGFGVISMMWFNAINGVAIFFMLAVHGQRPIRMDYSLFLRAAHGMLGTPVPLPAAPVRLPVTALRQFARFLGEHFLVNNFRWAGTSLVLRLPAARPSFGKNFASLFFFPGSRCSTLTLHNNGTVAVHCDAGDEQDLAGLQGRALPERAELEELVATAVTAAWQHFQAGHLPAAARLLGHVPETEVFVEAPARSRATYWVRWLLGVSVAFMLSIPLFLGHSLSPNLVPVTASEADVRGALKFHAGDQTGVPMALLRLYVLPPRDLFPAEALPKLEQNVLAHLSLKLHGAANLQHLSQDHSPQLDFVMLGGWISWDTLGVNPVQLGDHFRSLPVQTWPTNLTLRKSRVDGQEFLVRRIDHQTLCRLRWLASLNSLNLVDRPGLIRQICAVQVLGESFSPPLKNARDLHGLFFTPNWPVLEDTYLHLAALEVLGGLNQVDRAACVAAILKRHHGKGLFESPDFSVGESILGEAHDTFWAFESLRLLGALDQVKDLDQWQFRVPRGYRSTPVKNTGWLDWEEIEAWLCQQRLARIVAAHKANPNSPWRSLLEP